ncbi:alpha/beta hydrolase-fold protein [uncultured Kordia sp.]|uniref:alpha/beta hydrolase-fold protein n=1 Tax=uncultured Kordia sp. TaxID=507699 RepID=UPI002633E6C6|nr:alpha/beta hydrolase-fold protein [uncultured Kordia sp.]
MKFFKTFCSIYILLFLCISFAQNKAASEIEHTINSKVFGKERKVKVFLPTRYHRDSISKYAVTYVLDAQHQVFWDAAKGNIGYMVHNYSVIPMIVVGVVSDSRGAEFNPKSTKLQEHLQNEVFPLIAKTYRTDDFRTIVGHSWGGAFVGNTIFSDKRDMFDAYIGISPSFGDKDNVIVKHADSLLKNNTTFGKYLYFSHGDVGRRETEFAGYVNSIDSLLKKYPNKTIAWQPRPIEGVGHWQIVGPSICDGLISMSRNYFADQKVLEDFAKKGNLKTQIDQFNKQRKEIFGYVHEASVGYLNFVGNDFKGQKKYEIAIEIYKMALDKKPNDVRVNMSLSNLYDKINETALAKVTFTKTKELLEAQKADFSDNYYKNNMEWINERLATYE